MKSGQCEGNQCLLLDAHCCRICTVQVSPALTRCAVYWTDLEYRNYVLVFVICSGRRASPKVREYRDHYGVEQVGPKP